MGWKNVRKLAIFAFSFSGAVFLCNLLLPRSLWLLLALLFAAGIGLVRFCLKGRRRLLFSLICAGLAAGLLWTEGYDRLFFQPARDLDDRTVKLDAVVSDWPQKTDYGWSVLIRVKTGPMTKSSMILYVDEQGRDLQPGDNIAAVVHCTMGDHTFAGEEITYYVAKGIFLRGVAYGRLDVCRPDQIPIRHWAAVLSKELKAGIDAAFSPESAALVRALVTGNRDNLTDTFTTSLQRVGLSHTVAVSGMHLAFLAALLDLILGRGKKITAIITILWVVLFCGVAGNTPSVLRAAVMILLLQIAPLFGRERDGFTALATALMLLLAWNPYSAAHVGLQLSFGAVAGILLVADPIQNKLLSILHLDKRPKPVLLQVLILVPRFFVSTFAATLGASVLTVPLVALHFQNFSLISPLSNLLTLWAVAILFLGGLLLGLLGIACPGLASVLAIPFVHLANYLERVVDVLGQIPFAAIPLESFFYRAWVVFLCMLLAVTFLARGSCRLLLPMLAAGGTLAVCVLFTALTFRAGELTVAVLDVGQGQSVLLRSGNYLTLVDCGGDGNVNAGDTAADYIQSQGRLSLDLLVVSHYHADHANGIPQLLKRMDVSAIALPDVEPGDPLRGEILALAEEKEIEVWFIREDTYISLGENQEFILYAPLAQEGESNEIGLTVLATAGDFDVLLPGDMDGETEEKLLAHTELPDIELLVAGHHGSRYSTRSELLHVTRPDMAVISVGVNNRYGHPAQETLERLAVSGIDIYRTDLQGTVVVRSGPV